MKRLLAAAFLLACLSTNAAADIFRPAYLELRELGADRYAVLWKVPELGGEQRLSAYVRFPDGTETVTSPHVTSGGGAWTERWEIRFEGGLAGHTISIEGKAVGVTEVIARVERQDGSSQVESLPIAHPEFTVLAAASRGRVAWTYLLLGIDHILGGIDHLLFVLALLLIVRGTRRIIATITAFTVAHSITLAAATLGFVHVPGPPVEAMIALSIVFVASEVVHGYRGRPGLTERAPWIVAFSFGLLHGFGFAGALAEVGLPQAAIPIALFTFNVGVECGQLMFVGAVLGLRFLIMRGVRNQDDWLPVAASYGIGTVAAFWTIQRVASFWA
ncbi:MAG: HupE/UreJ family protein [Woeseiaceae bacterium]